MLWLLFVGNSIRTMHIYIRFVGLETSSSEFQRAPSPSDFPLLNYFWIYFTCGFDIRDSLFGSLVTHYGSERVNYCISFDLLAIIIWPTRKFFEHALWLDFEISTWFLLEFVLDIAGRLPCLAIWPLKVS